MLRINNIFPIHSSSEYTTNCIIKIKKLVDVIYLNGAAFSVYQCTSKWEFDGGNGR